MKLLWNDHAPSLIVALAIVLPFVGIFSRFIIANILGWWFIVAYVIVVFFSLMKKAEHTIFNQRTKKFSP